MFQGGNFFSNVLMWLAFAFSMVVAYGLSTWLPKLMQVAGLPVKSALWMLVVLSIGGICGSVFGGWLASKWGFRNTIVLYFAAAFAAIVSIAFIPTTVQPVVLFIAGFTTNSLLIIMTAFAVEFYPPEVRSTALGWGSGAGRAGAIAGPALGGALLALNLSFQQNFFAVAAPCILGAICILLVSQRVFRGAPASGL